MDFLRHWQTAAGANQGARVNVTLTSGPLSSDPLASVTDGLGAVTTVAYKALPDPTVYQKGSGAVFPLVEVQNPSCLVSAVGVPNGIGGARTTSYFYTQARAHLQGRGYLGFATMSATDSGGDAGADGDVKTTTYSPSFPYIGQVTRTEQRRVDNNRLIGETDHTLASLTTATSSVAGQAPALFAYVSSAVTKTYEPANNPSTLVSTTTLTSSYDGFGNQTSVTVSGDGITTRTTSTVAGE
jgi:hypothetical protein